MAPKETAFLKESDNADTRKVVVVMQPREYRYLWIHIISFCYLHMVSLYGIYLMVASAKFMTVALAFTLLNMGTLGATCGAHRLWSHRSYKAKTPLKVLLVLMQTLSFQFSAITWAGEHRIHHKFSDTDADPYNASRGFFFSHIGWVLTEHHPDFEEKRKGIDISDLTSDPILNFQYKYYAPLVIFVSIFLPTAIPMYFWAETFLNAFVLNHLRFCLGVHAISSINSFAHMFGNKPYDRFINPVENVGVAFAALGEGWHNYHHAFPWDYKASELGKYSTNMSMLFIDFMAKIGWAYDLKTVSNDAIRKKVIRTGDGTHNLWGWSDKDMTAEDRKSAIIINKEHD